MNTIEFIKSLKSWEVELNDLKSKITWKQANWNTTDNIYFLAWVKEWLNKRAWDKDIVSKKYFCIDVDMRNQTDIEITNDEIKDQWLMMAKFLVEEDKILWQWRHIVYSWNWLHVYYEIEEKAYDPVIYAAWVEVMFENWDEYWWDEVYFSDKACKNIARILRMPWSVNQKNWAVVEILASQDVKLDVDIEKLWKNAIKEIEDTKLEEIRKRAEEYEKQVRMEQLINWDEDNVVVNKKAETEELFRKLDDIPAYIVSEKLHPEFKYFKNNRNFLSDTKKWNQFTAFFYSSKMNWIVNWWSHFYNWGNANSCYSNSVLVKNELGLDWKQTVKWFKANFKIT